MSLEFHLFSLLFRPTTLLISGIFLITFPFIKKLDFINSITLIKDNLEASPIYSISISLTGQCNENESIYKIGYFPGIINGRVYKNRVFSGKCTKLYSNCKSIEKIDGFDLNIWDGNTFCVNKNPQFNYETFIRNAVENNNECDIGFKKCGILDTYNRIMCVEEYNDCPINKIIIDNNEISPSDYNYKTLSLNNNKYLHYTNESINNSVIVNISISSGIPCSDPNEINTKYPQYILDGNFFRYFCSNKLNDKFNDDIYTFIDSIKKSKLYYDNDIYEHINDLNNYPIHSLDENIELYTRNYFGMDKKYFENKTVYIQNKLNQSSDYYIQFNKKMKDATSYSFFLYLSSMVHMYVTFCKETNKCGRTMNFVLTFINIIFWYVISVLCFSGYSYIKNYNLFNFGFDQNRNFIIKNHMKLIEKNKKIFLVIIIFTFLYYIGVVIILIRVKIRIKKIRINRSEDFSIELRRIN